MGYLRNMMEYTKWSYKWIQMEVSQKKGEVPQTIQVMDDPKLNHFSIETHGSDKKLQGIDLWNSMEWHEMTGKNKEMKLKDTIFHDWFSGWWLKPSWKIWKSMGRIIPYIMENKTCSKPPTRNWKTHFSMIDFGLERVFFIRWKSNSRSKSQARCGKW